MGSPRHALQRLVTPSALGLSGVDLTAARTSNSVDVSGFNSVAIEVDYTYSAGTAVTMYLEVTDSLAGSPTWRRVQGTSLSSGTVTSSNLLYSYTHGGADASWVWNVPVNYKYLRLVFDDTGSPDADDVITVRLRKGLV